MDTTNTAAAGTPKDARSKTDRRKGENKIVRTLFRSYGVLEERSGKDRRNEASAAEPS